MCGLAALIYKNQSYQSENISKLLHKLHSTLNHRGPDGHGYLSYDQKNSPVIRKQIHELPMGNIYFVHTRLSIVDNNPKSDQPMTDPSNKLSIIFNGEIYNYIEIKQELIDIGYTFKTHSDTEVILLGFLEWGEKILNKIKGMYSLLILDTAKKRIFIARDPFGIKPLYYSINSNGYFFASEIKVLINIPGINRKLNTKVAVNYLRYNSLDNSSSTFFQDIRKFPSGHYAYLHLEGMNTFDPIRYYESNAQSKWPLSFKEASTSLREIFLDSMQRHTNSRGKLATMLSGGIDSSSIVMGLQKVQETSKIINTFTYSSEDTFDEIYWADMINSQENVVGHIARYNYNTLRDDIHDVIYTQDEPFGSTSILAQYQVLKIASQQGVRVILDGQGADELFAGYETCYAAKFSNYIKQYQFLKAGIFLKNYLFNNKLKLKDLLYRSAKISFPIPIQKILRGLILDPQCPAYLNKECHPFLGHPLTLDAGDTSFRHYLNLLLYSTNLPALLRFGDRNSMRFSIENRFPFLYIDLVNFAKGLEDDYLLDSRCETKYVLREAMRGIVPNSILDRKDKIGFVSMDNFILNRMSDWVQDCLSSDFNKRAPILDIDYLRKNIDTNVNVPLWRCLNFIQWGEIYNISI